MDMILRIRDLREDRDLKQREIAELLLCDQSLYSKYERGERELPLHLAIQLAEFYGMAVPVNRDLYEKLQAIETNW